VTWKPADGSLSYPYIRELEMDIYGEWFTVDSLPGGERQVERLRPIKLARAYEIAEAGRT
jgi:hypothetical protein